mgnify:FL=1
MSNIKVFEDKKIRTQWNANEEDWYFSVVDVVEALTDSPNPQTYWRVLKKRLKDEGNETVTNCNALKMIAKDGKSRLTDVVNTKDLLRLVQSIPSKKAEPFKMWLAQVGSERLDEIADPQKAIDRAVETYRQKGYPEEWITQRMMTIKMRKELTDEWQNRGITQEKDYAILTNEMTKAWSGMSIQEYKQLKGLKKENLRDNMTNIELVLNMLAEVTTTAMSKEQKPNTMAGHKQVARQGGEVAKTAKIAYEQRVGKKAISPLNADNKNLLEIKPDEDK